MEPIQAQMVFCCAEQWMGGLFHHIEPWGDGLRLGGTGAVTGVYCLVGMQAVFKPVDVVYQGDKYYLVEPAKLADDTENTSSSRLREGDSVLITAMELYDGKVLEA